MIPIDFQVIFSSVKVNPLFWALWVVHFIYFNPLLTCFGQVFASTEKINLNLHHGGHICFWKFCCYSFTWVPRLWPSESPRQYYLFIWWGVYWQLLSSASLNVSQNFVWEHLIIVLLLINFILMFMYFFLSNEYFMIYIHLSMLVHTRDNLFIMFRNKFVCTCMILIFTNRQWVYRVKCD